MIFDIILGVLFISLGLITLFLTLNHAKSNPTRFGGDVKLIIVSIFIIIGGTYIIVKSIFL